MDCVYRAYMYSETHGRLWAVTLSFISNGREYSICCLLVIADGMHRTQVVWLVRTETLLDTSTYYLKISGKNVF